MGYLDKATITVDAILTNRGRELLARGGINDDVNSFKITKFAVADDEVNYGLYDTTFGNSSDWGYIIENMPVLEATPDEQQIMRYKLVTLSANDGGTIEIPRLLVGGDQPLVLNASGNASGPKTLNISTSPAQQEDYVLTIGDARKVRVQLGNANAVDLYNLSDVNANYSITRNLTSANSGGISLKFTARTNNEGRVLYPGKTTATIFGVNSGVTATFEITVS
jgi:hypothetical protein